MKIMMVRSYDKILEETKLKLAAEKNGKLFIGSLWMEPVSESIAEIMASVEIDDNSSAMKIANEAYKLSEKFEKLAKDGSSWGCYAHWSWINGLAEDIDTSAVYGGKMPMLEKEKALLEAEIKEIDEKYGRGEMNEGDYGRNLVKKQMDLKKIRLEIKEYVNA